MPEKTTLKNVFGTIAFVVVLCDDVLYKLFLHFLDELYSMFNINVKVIYYPYSSKFTGNDTSCLSLSLHALPSQIDGINRFRMIFSTRCKKYLISRVIGMM